ncbi:hypothetical protein ColKHC_07607 [Colletotrichum higginsianum]|nr:hypothetical protein ColKHC_07607 [Colletotrichum higginsianum]
MPRSNSSNNNSARAAQDLLAMAFGGSGGGGRGGWGGDRNNRNQNNKRNAEEEADDDEARVKRLKSEAEEAQQKAAAKAVELEKAIAFVNGKAVLLTYVSKMAEGHQKELLKEALRGLGHWGDIPALLPAKDQQMTKETAGPKA